MTPKQMMLKDGAPAALFMTPTQRAKAWSGRPLTTVPLFQAVPKNEDVATKAFRAQEDERRRLKSLQQIGKMKARMMTKKIDHDLMRWDPRTCRFVEDTGAKAEPTIDHDRDRGVVHLPRHPKEKQSFAEPRKVLKRTQTAIDKAIDTLYWARVKSHNARQLAELNGVWEQKYEKLSGGLLVMTVTNRLKGLVSKGGEVKWT